MEGVEAQRESGKGVAVTERSPQNLVLNPFFTLSKMLIIVLLSHA
jgi:hypothetical protein